jgi:hypothetical protein
MRTLSWLRVCWWQNTKHSTVRKVHSLIDRCVYTQTFSVPTISYQTLSSGLKNCLWTSSHSNLSLLSTYSKNQTLLSIFHSVPVSYFKNRSRVRLVKTDLYGSLLDTILRLVYLDLFIVKLGDKSKWKEICTELRQNMKPEFLIVTVSNHEQQDLILHEIWCPHLEEFKKNSFLHLSQISGSEGKGLFIINRWNESYMGGGKNFPCLLGRLLRAFFLTPVEGRRDRWTD